MRRAARSLTLLAAVALATACKGGATKADTLNRRAIALKNNGDYDRAIQLYDSAIALQPKAPGLRNNRGIAYLLKGDFTRAIQDYDSALALNPKHETALVNRGRAQFFLGKFSEAAADIRQQLTFAESTATKQADHMLPAGSTYSLIWFHLASRDAGASDSAVFASLAARIDTTAWPGPVLNYLLGRATADQLMAAAEHVVPPDTPEEQRCSVKFYIAESLRWAGKTNDAKANYQSTLNDCPKRFSEYIGAQMALARLSK